MLWICRGGRGVPGHREIIVFDENLHGCPLCKEREKMAGEIESLKDDLAALKEILAEKEKGEK